MQAITQPRILKVKVAQISLKVRDRMRQSFDLTLQTRYVYLIFNSLHSKKM